MQNLKGCLLKVAETRMDVTSRLRQMAVRSPQDRYDLEYSTAKELSEIIGCPCKFEDTHYWFWSPVLKKSFLREIVGAHHRVLDVGAGNATLLYYMSEEAKEGKNAFLERRPPDFDQFPRLP